MNGTAVEDYSNVIGTDTSFGQGVIAGSQVTDVGTPVQGGIGGLTAPTPPIPLAGIPIAGSAPNFFSGLLSAFTYKGSKSVDLAGYGTVSLPQVQKALYDTTHIYRPQTGITGGTLVLRGLA